MKRIIISIAMVAISASVSWGAGKSEGWAMGGNFHILTPNQSDMNSLVSRANTRAGGINTPQLGTAYEFSAYIHYRFSSSIIAFQFRPSYFLQSAAGTDGSGNSYKYGLNGFSLMPMLRWYLLESDAIRFFLNTGLGYGMLFGDIQEADFSVGFSGNSIGYMGGLGVEFCYGSHCCNIEGNVRYLYYERNIASRSSGTVPVATPGISQANSGNELEIDNRDLSTTMSGIQGTIGYMYYF